MGPPSKLLLLLSDDEPQKYAPMRFTPGGCCPCGTSDSDVLIWGEIHGGALNSYTLLSTTLTALDLVVHDHEDWTGNILDYRLVFWPVETTDEPEWWATIEANEWTGRLVIGGDSTTGSAAINAYVDSLSPTTGIGLNADSNDINLQTHEGIPLSNALTQGVTSIRFRNTAASTSGGTGLCRTSNNVATWMARNKPSGSLAEFVVAGNYLWLEDVTYAGANTDTFIENCWTVEI